MESIAILYVEDELSLGKITNDTLKKNGFNVIWAKDGKEALEIILKSKIDIAVIDIMMPKLDGFNLVIEIRKTNNLLPILFLTARVLTEDVIKGFEIGGNDYMKKPFSIEELIIRIKELVKRNKISNPLNTYLIGKYTFNYVRMEITLQDQKISLTHRENEIIKRLYLRANEIVSRTEILIDLWGDDSYYNGRSLDVFITKIRKYFSEDQSIAIKNIRGVGYKLIVS
ncbi:MAG: response regulator transcription factor [Flavobacterium sp.]|jgi:DNA-binding response OmpR family regulator|uniref:response regulator transcription factor n=1 Tax=Flavobacterium sp. TaxID=239 RepID=UPI0022BEA00A|nr:response regulator transcription factor [Flavobacterium sp.]MCZ8090761.1 response regulator transcription factor [Flavobacterium sp.]MCZ8332222.1 response regulator transcription factor [Flavobacterium sp.]